MLDMNDLSYNYSLFLIIGSWQEGIWSIKSVFWMPQYNDIEHKLRHRRLQLLLKRCC